MAKFVGKQDIVREYSDTVAGLLATGWTIFTPSMGGSQGEDAHVDVISKDHKVVYRVLLYKDGDWGDGSDHKYVISVHGYVPADVYKDAGETWDSLYEGGYCTIWNERGVEVSKRVFYAMAQGSDRRNCHYTTDETVPAQAKARREYKWKNRLYDHSSRWGNEKLNVKVDAAKLVKFVRAHGGRGYGNCKADEIKAVTKYGSDGQMHYVIEFTGAKKNLVF